MLPLLSKIARKLGLVTFYMVIVREKKDGSIRIREESFPQNDLVDVGSLHG